MKELTLLPLETNKPAPPVQHLRYKKDPNKKVNNRRYYYHRLLKDKYEINGVLRTIKVPYKEFKAIPVPDRYYVGQLIQMGYNMQLELYK